MAQGYTVSDIFPLSDFQRNTKKHLQRLKKNKRPEVLTLNGKAEVVVIDAATYEKMQDELEYWDTVAKIREGLRQAEEGKLIPMDKAFEQIRRAWERG